MNRKEAELLDRRTGEYLFQTAKAFHMDESFAASIMEQHLEIIPESDKKEIVFLGTDSFSVKPGNIKLDMKKLLAACAELFVSVNAPENIFNYIQLALMAFMFAAKTTVKTLNSDCAVIIYTLAQLGACESYVAEKRLEEAALRTCTETGRPPISDFRDSLNQLLELQVIKMEDGKVSLQETVWGRI